MLVFEYQCKLKFLKNISHKTIAGKINYFLDSVIGDQVIIGPDETLFPLDMAENLGMFDEIDPLSQISETDPRQWQMEWMDNYMDALEELEDSTTRE